MTATEQAPAVAWSVRPYEGGQDFHMIESWWSHHNPGNGNPFRETLLPPDGWVVEKDGEPVAAGWLYKSYGIGVAFLEHLVTRPGMTVGLAVESLGHVLGAAKAHCREFDYGIIVAHALPGVARHASRLADTVNGERTQLLFSTWD